MFTELYDGLMRLFRSGQAAQLCRRFATGEDAYAPTPLPPEPLISEQARSPQARANARAARRQALLSALTSAPSAARETGARDAAAALCGELSWSDVPGLPRGDASHPAIDLAAAETGVLLAWAAELLPELAPAREFLRGEIQRRLLRPAAAHEDYDFLQGRGGCAMAICADLILCALLMERDELRLGRVLRALVRAMDRAEPSVPLRERLIDATAAADLCDLTGLMTDRVPADSWLDSFYCAWIRADLFCDADGLNPRLPGCDLFRLGQAAGDRAVRMLGAALYRQRPRRSLTVTGTLCAQALEDALEAETGEPPRLRCGCTPDQRLMVSRSPELCCMLRADTGLSLLFSGADAILTDGRDGERSLPRIGTFEPEAAIGDAPAADFDRRDDREHLSADLTKLYPPQCGVRSFQRTAMFLRGERAVRLVDAVELARPQRIARRYVCGVQPVEERGALRLGRVRMTWEGEAAPQIAPLDANRWLITFADPDPVARGIYTCSFEWTQR